jgi:hypothetical protein
MTYREPLDRDPPLADLTPRTWIAISSAITATSVVLLTLLIWSPKAWLDFRYASDGDGGTGFIASLGLALTYGFAILVVNSLSALVACAILALVRLRR